MNEDRKELVVSLTWAEALYLAFMVILGWNVGAWLAG